MQRYKLKHLIVLLSLLLFSGQMAAQEIDSLRTYLRVAAENNPGVRSNFTAYQAAMQKVPQAGAIADPTLDVGFFFKPMDIVGGRQVADFTLMQMFPWFGTKKAAQTEATHMAKQAYEQFRESRDNVFLEVYTQWYSISKLNEQLKNNKENEALLTQLYDLAVNKYATSTGMEVESGGMSEVLRIQLEITELESNIETIESEIKTEQVKLNSLLNRPNYSPLVVSQTLQQIPFLFNEDMIDKIEAFNPSLEILLEEKKAYEAQETLIKKESLPSWGVGLNYTLVNKAHSDMAPMWGDMNGADMFMPMLSVSIPIYRNKYKAKQKESQLWQLAAQEKYENTLNTLNAEMYQAKHELEDADRKIKLYRKQTELANTTYNMAVQEYITNKSDLTNLIQIQRQLLDYKLKTTDAVANYNTKVATLQKLISFSNLEN